MNIMLNTLEFAEAFETAGFGHDQAKALAVAFGKAHEAGREDVITKLHLDLKMTELDARMHEMEVRLTKHIGEVAKDVTGRLWTTIAVIAAVATAVSATIGAGMVFLLRSGGL
jgi:hypothetical protein